MDNGADIHHNYERLLVTLNNANSKLTTYIIDSLWQKASLYPFICKVDKDNWILNDRKSNVDDIQKY